MPKFHVHVYRTTQLYETDIEAEDMDSALKQAHEEAKKPSSLWRPPDRDFIAATWPERGGA